MISITQSFALKNSFPCGMRGLLGLQQTRPLSSSARSAVARRLDGLDAPTVWHEFSPLAQEYQSINLGQGFPDWEPPAFVCEAMRRSVEERHANQYARSYAHMPLAQVLAEEYSLKLGQEINPATQVATAVGCTNALYCALQGLLNPGDEALLLEPAFDIYSSQVKMAGGVPVYVPLRPHVEETGASRVFQLDLNELAAAITPNTKVILLNTPHNPTGKMFNMEELQGIADIVARHPQLTVIADEVYEHLVYDDEKHVSFASLLFDQTLTLSSSGKTFSCTGWKVGWAVGPRYLVQAVNAVQQWVNFSAPTPNQDAMAQALVRAREPFRGYASYYQYLIHEYRRKRELLATALTAAGMQPILPPGGFFIMADTSRIKCPESYRKEVTLAAPVSPMPRDWAMSRWLTQEIGVTAIPPSAFYSSERIPLASNLLRFVFCKGDETLKEAQKRLEKIRTFYT